MIRGVVFTINNPGDFEPAWMEAAMDYMCYVPQVGDQGTPHLQGMAIYKKKMRKATIEKWLTEGFDKRCYVAKMMGTPQQARSYIVDDKKKTNAGDVVEKGEIPEGFEEEKCTAGEQLLMIKDLILTGEVTTEDQLYMEHSVAMSRKGTSDVLLRILQIHRRSHGWEYDVPLDIQCPLFQSMALYLANPPEYRKFQWYVDPEGKVGKTTRLKWLYNAALEAKLKPFYIGCEKRANIAHMTPEETNVFLVDVPRAAAIPYAIIEQFRDGSMTSGKWHGSVKKFPKDRWMVVCSNALPDASRITMGDFNLINWPPSKDDSKEPVVNDTFVGPRFTRK